MTEVIQFRAPFEDPDPDCCDDCINVFHIARKTVAASREIDPVIKQRIIDDLRRAEANTR